MPNDIRIHIGFPDHPKTKKLAKKCGYDGVVCLLRIWCWAAENRTNGVLSNMDSDDIEIVAGWTGKDGALISALTGPWIDIREDGVYSLHDWEENQPWVFHADERSKIARNAAKKRWESKGKSMHGACGKHAEGMHGACTEHADSNAPSPNPSPSPIPEKPLCDESHDEPFYLTAKKKKLTGKRLEAFEQFWEAFNYKKSKSSAADSWISLPRLDKRIMEQILKSAKIEAVNRQSLIDQGRTPKMAQGWLTERRWEDETNTHSPTQQQSYLDQCKAEQDKYQPTPQELLG